MAGKERYLDEAQAAYRRALSLAPAHRSAHLALGFLLHESGRVDEACPLGLAPTASTTALLAMGDALAVVLINKKHFKTSDFKRFHPGGALGQRLSRQVKDIMFTGEAIPSVTAAVPMQKAVEEMDRHGLGALIVIEREVRLNNWIKKGVILDAEITAATTTVLEAARRMGLDIPGLCWKASFEPATCCMACVVRVDDAEGLVSLEQGDQAATVLGLVGHLGACELNQGRK